MKTITNKWIFQSYVILLLASCSIRTEDSEERITQDKKACCICPEGALSGKAQLEAGMRGQVKFQDEPENLNSITGKMSEYNIPALSLAIIHQGRVEWADLYKNEKYSEVQNLNCSSVFQAASLSKPVTLMAAIRMQAEGKIDLDEDIENYLNSYELPRGKQTAENPVTLRNILSHTSGITSGGYQGYSRDMLMPSDLEILTGGEGVNSPAIEVVSVPGELLAYSGGGYTLAELALQDIFGEEFSEIMQEWIIDPAGMGDSEFTQPMPASDSGRVAIGYSFSEEVVDGGWRNHPEQAAAGLWSNSVDMAKFLIEIFNAYQGKKSIFTREDIMSMLSHERDGHIYGFIVNREGDDISITHYGGNMGYRTGMTISLTTGNGLVYLINSDNGGALGNELLLSASEVYHWSHFKQTLVKRRIIEPDILKELEGKYKWNGQVDLPVTFNEKNNQISLHFPNGDEYMLTPIVSDDLEFIHENTGITISFLENENYRSFTLYGQTANKL